MIKFFIYFTIILALLLWGVRWIQQRAVYFPMKAITTNPFEAGFESYEDVYFESVDRTKLHGWWVPKQDASGTVIFCHGNAGNIGHRLDKVRILHALGLNVFIFDYRGFGESEGHPSERGLYRDAQAAYDTLLSRRQLPAHSIVLYGESLGGAVATDLAGRVPVRALVVEDTFTSLKDIAKIAAPLMPSILFTGQFDTLSKIRKVKAPVLVIHSADDEIIPYRMGEELHRAAAFSKSFLKLRGNHNTATFESAALYRDGLRAFLIEGRASPSLFEPTGGRIGSAGESAS